MTDPIAAIIRDYRAFAAQQRDRLLSRGAALDTEPVLRQRPFGVR